MPYLNKSDLFGQAVNNKFPSAVDEFKSAGNCIAANLNSAAIFHLMRVVECGLNTLAHSLGIQPQQIQHKTWGQILQIVEPKINDKIKNAPPSEESENETIGVQGGDSAGSQPKSWPAMRR